MKISHRNARILGSFLVTLALAAGALSTRAEDKKVPLDIKLPTPGFKGTPKDIQLSDYVEPLSDKPRPPMMVPAGLKNLAKDAKLTCSDKNANAETLAKLNDGDKEASDSSIIFFRKGSQWV